MSSWSRGNVWLAVVLLVVCVLVLQFWIPVDVDSGAFVKVRSRIEIGDALAPIVAVSVLILGAVLLLSEARKGKSELSISTENLAFFVGMFLLLALTFAVMRWAGPLVISIFGIGTGEYRPLRDTVPWKFVGYFFGSTLLIWSVIGLIERRFFWTPLVIGIAATLGLIILYGVPFDNLQLPPNADI